MSGIASRAAIRSLFGVVYMYTFFKRNEIFSKYIQNVKMPSFLHFLFHIAI